VELAALSVELTALSETVELAALSVTVELAALSVPSHSLHRLAAGPVQSQPSRPPGVRAGRRRVSHGYGLGTRTRSSRGGVGRLMMGRNSRRGPGPSDTVGRRPAHLRFFRVCDRKVTRLPTPTGSFGGAAGGGSWCGAAIVPAAAAGECRRRCAGECRRAGAGGLEYI
jgi:hypothetical protein